MLYIGLMSGTSLDGVDAVLADFSHGLRVLGHVSQPLAAAMRGTLLALNQPAPNELHQAMLAANAVARLYAQAVAALLQATGVAAHEVVALGAHGQTVRHRPGEFDGTGYTVQLLNGALLAELAGIDVVADLRSRDVAAGGQGAPLVPAFHAAVFGQNGLAQAVLNLGGIANLTLLGTDGQVGGFDCGPANALMDGWCAQHLGQAFDAGGAWAASGQLDQALLDAMLAEPFFQRAPPKSTGRDLFHAGWLAGHLADGRTRAAADVQATLAELTARSAVQALGRHATVPVQRLLVCGGGALNSHLMRRLAALLAGTPVVSTAEAGLPPLQVEAAAFAWLARAFVTRQAGNRPEVTGASGPRVLGALHPAR